LLCVIEVSGWNVWYFNLTYWLASVYRVRSTMNTTKITFGRTRVYDAQFLNTDLVLLLAEGVILLIDVEGLEEGEYDVDEIEDVRRVELGGGWAEGGRLACNEGRGIVGLCVGNRTLVHVVEVDD
jgi:hypothetical protein